jgi:hypothetical protein
MQLQNVRIMIAQPENASNKLNPYAWYQQRGCNIFDKCLQCINHKITAAAPAVSVPRSFPQPPCLSPEPSPSLFQSQTTPPPLLFASPSTLWPSYTGYTSLACIPSRPRPRTVLMLVLFYHELHQQYLPQPRQLRFEGEPRILVC